jgi:hypothetical protein
VAGSGYDRPWLLKQEGSTFPANVGPFIAPGPRYQIVVHGFYLHLRTHGLNAVKKNRTYRIVILCDRQVQLQVVFGRFRDPAYSPAPPCRKCGEPYLPTKDPAIFLVWAAYLIGAGHSFVVFLGDCTPAARCRRPTRLAPPERPPMPDPAAPAAAPFGALTVPRHPAACAIPAAA